MVKVFFFFFFISLFSRSLALALFAYLVPGAFPRQGWCKSSGFVVACRFQAIEHEACTSGIGNARLLSPKACGAKACQHGQCRALDATCWLVRAV